jgi:hypothetical protein
MNARIQSSLILSALMPMITATCIARPEKAQDPADVLKLTFRLDKRVIRLGDSIKGTFNVTNTSGKTVRLVKYGALYMAFWFRFESDHSLIMAEEHFEKLFVPEVGADDFVTLARGSSYTVFREGTARPSNRFHNEIYLDFLDSGFHLKCGKTYSVSGLFWARPDPSRRFQVISGRIHSARTELHVSPCK